MLLLKGFPIPPSSNQMYASVNGRLIKSAEARRYLGLVQGYKIRKFREIDEFLKTVVDADVFDVEMNFIFHRDRVIGKKNQIKKLDASNRLKASHDGLAEILDIDDSRFVSGSFKKCYTPFIQEEQVIIVVKKTAILSLDELLSMPK